MVAIASHYNNEALIKLKLTRDSVVNIINHVFITLGFSHLIKNTAMHGFTNFA